MCLSNLRQVLIASHIYANDYDNHLPRASAYLISGFNGTHGYMFYPPSDGGRHFGPAMLVAGGYLEKVDSGSGAAQVPFLTCPGSAASDGGFLNSGSGEMPYVWRFVDHQSQREISLDLPGTRAIIADRYFRYDETSIMKGQLNHDQEVNVAYIDGSAITKSNTKSKDDIIPSNPLRSPPTASTWVSAVFQNPVHSNYAHWTPCLKLDDR